MLELRKKGDQSEEVQSTRNKNMCTKEVKESEMIDHLCEWPCWPTHGDLGTITTSPFHPQSSLPLWLGYRFTAKRPWVPQFFLKSLRSATSLYLPSSLLLLLRLWGEMSTFIDSHAHGPPTFVKWLCSGKGHAGLLSPHFLPSAKHQTIAFLRLGLGVWNENRSAGPAFWPPYEGQVIWHGRGSPTVDTPGLVEIALSFLSSGSNHLGGVHYVYMQGHGWWWHGLAMTQSVLCTCTGHEHRTLSKDWGRWETVVQAYKTSI